MQSTTIGDHKRLKTPKNSQIANHMVSSEFIQTSYKNVKTVVLQ